MNNKNLSSIQSPLAKAKGLGSSHHGTHHMIAHDITTLTNIPLVLWVMYSVFSLRAASYDEIMAWLAQPLSVIMIILFVVSVFRHFALELQVVFEDYVSCKMARIMMVIGTKLLFFVVGLATILSVLKIAFSAGI